MEIVNTTNGKKEGYRLSEFAKILASLKTVGEDFDLINYLIDCKEIDTNGNVIGNMFDLTNISNTSGKCFFEGITTSYILISFEGMRKFVNELIG